MAYNVKFYAGGAMPATGNIDPNAFYYIDNKDLYLGNIKLSNGADLAEAVNNIGANADAIAAINLVLSELTGGESGAGSIASQLATLKAELQEALETGDQAVVGQVTTESERAQGAEATLQSNIDKLAETVSTNKTALDTEDTRLAGLIEANTKEIQDAKSSLEEAIDSVTVEAQTRANADIELTNAINAEKARIDALVGDDDSSTIREIAYLVLSEELLGEEVATDNFKTLQELATWLEEHPEEAAEMNQLISDNAANIAANTKLINDNKAATDGSISNLQGQITGQGESITGIQSDIQDIQGVIKEKITDGGILTEAQSYTNTKVGELADVVAGNGNNISDLQTRMGTAEGNIANHAITLGSHTTDIETLTSKISTLVGSHTGTLGTAAFKNEDAFASAEAVTKLESDLTSYIDTALTWNPIQQ